MCDSLCNRTIVNCRCSETSCLISFRRAFSITMGHNLEPWDTLSSSLRCFRQGFITAVKLASTDTVSPSGVFWRTRPRWAPQVKEGGSRHRDRTLRQDLEGAGGWEGPARRGSVFSHSSCLCPVVHYTQLLLLYCELGLKSAEEEAGVDIRGNGWKWTTRKV